MNIMDVGKRISKFAPLVGSILPIPGGELIGQAIASIFGGDIRNPDDLIKRIESDKDAPLKLAQFQLEHKVELERIAMQSFQLEVQDKASARATEIERLKDGDNVTSFIALILTIATFIMCFGLTAMIYFGAIQKAEVELVKDIIEKSFMAEMLVLSYYFGASKKRN